MHKDKCQFAHGLEDLKSGGSGLKTMDYNNNNMNMNMNNNMNNMNNQFKNKKTPNPQNFKIVKCVNFDNCNYFFINYSNFTYLFYLFNRWKL